MARFEIRTPSGATTVDAENWMEALGYGLSAQGLDNEDLSRVVCDINADGSIMVQDPNADTTFEIRELEEGDGGMSPVQVRLGQATTQAEVGVRVAQAATAVDLDGDIDGQLDAPDPRSSAAFEVASEAGMDRLEALVDADLGIQEADIASTACEAALTLLMRFVPAESGAVLLLTPGGSELIFAAAKGPRSKGVSDLRIPAKAGIAGVSVNANTAMWVREVGRDNRHYTNADERSGYQTRALLAVPLRGPSGRTHGVLELLNPFGNASFEEWHLDAAQMVGAKLATRLG
ncbi:MAG: hypothetical protein ACI9VR_002055 [Cognaticolwellia sp.]|jgi:hypothetical protein